MRVSKDEDASVRRKTNSQSNDPKKRVERHDSDFSHVALVFCSEEEEVDEIGDVSPDEGSFLANGKTKSISSRRLENYRAPKGTYRDDDCLEIIKRLPCKTVLVSQLHRLSNDGNHRRNESLKERDVLLILESEVLGDLSKSTRLRKIGVEGQYQLSSSKEQRRDISLTSRTKS